MQALSDFSHSNAGGNLPYPAHTLGVPTTTPANLAETAASQLMDILSEIKPHLHAVG
jgi:hypothetical protein